MITFYGYKKCTTSQKGEKKLREKGIPYNFIDITTAPPTQEELEQIIAQSGEPIKKFFNTSGQEYRAQNLKAKLPLMAEEDMLPLLASSGRLIKRPIVTNGKMSTVGYKEENFIATWMNE